MSSKELNKTTLSDSTTRHNGLYIMLRLVYFVLPLAPIMLITIVMGVLGFLVAIGITVLGSIAITKVLTLPDFPQAQTLTSIFQFLAAFAIARGALRYMEQYSGYFIAFKLLAFMRDKIYKALRKLAPAKLDGKRAGRLISIITSDVELLEVFFAHTIAPIMIGIITSLIMVVFIGYYSTTLAWIALAAYLTIGLIIPYFTSKKSREDGLRYREDVAEINNAFLESLYGMREIILFRQAQRRQEFMDQKSLQDNQSVENLKEHQGITKALSETAILVFSMAMLFTGVYLTIQG